MLRPQLIGERKLLHWLDHKYTKNVHALLRHVTKLQTLLAASKFNSLEKESALCVSLT